MKDNIHELSENNRERRQEQSIGALAGEEDGPSVEYERALSPDGTPRARRVSSMCNTHNHRLINALQRQPVSA
jgi:hypothetical protein